MLNTSFVNTLLKAGLTNDEAISLMMSNETFIYRLANVHKNHINYVQQYAGAYRTIEYKDRRYRFMKEKSDYSVIYTLKQNENDGNDACIVIMVDPTLDHAYIYNISNIEGCLKKGMIMNKGGKELMNIATKLVYAIKDKYNIDYIQLMDNATVYIREERIILRYLRYLTKGKTWYEKFGYVPCEFDIVSGKTYIDNDFKSRLNKQTVLYMKKKVKDIQIDKSKMYEIIGEHNKKRIKELIQSMKNNMDVMISMYIKEICLKYYLDILNGFMRYIVKILSLDISHTVCVKL